MTLERHRSHLIPDVTYSLDGTLFVTDNGGTFPLRGKGKSHKNIKDQSFQSPEPAPSYLSYDARRDEKKRRYKQRPSPNRFGAEVQNISGYSTISTNTSSLGRRLRRSKRKYASVRGREYQYSRRRDNGEFQFKENGYSSVSGGSTGRRLRGGTPQMTPEFKETLKRKKTSRSLDMGALNSKESPYDRKRRDSYDKNGFNSRDPRRHSNKSIHSFHEKQRLRKIHDEKLPYLPFLINGVFLIIVGIVRLILSYWHEYYCALWAGLLCILLGVIGAKHKGLYLAKGVNAAYILFGFLVSAAMLAAIGFVAHVLVPTITFLADDLPPSEVVKKVTFTNMDKTLASLSLSTSSVLWASLALDLASVIFIFIGMFAVTAAMVAISNHWDAAYDTTADCDHRGNPRLFNPIEQVALGEATVTMGLVYSAAQAGFSTVSQHHYYLPVVAGALVMLAGVVSFCFGKRTDVRSLGTFACVFEFLSFIAACGASVVVILGIVDNVTAIQRGSSGLPRKEQMSISVIGGALTFVLAINVIFIVGTLFRQFRQVCCRECCAEDGDVTDSYGTMGSRRGSYSNTIDRRRR